MRLSVKILPADTLIKLLDERELDHVLCKSVEEPRMPTTMLWSDKLVWCGSREALGAQDDEIRLIAFSEPCRYRERAVGVLALQNRPWRIVYESPSLAGVRGAIDAGIGVTVLPTSLVDQPHWSIPASALPAPGNMSFVLMSRPDIDDVANLTFRDVLLEMIPPYSSPFSQGNLNNRLSDA